MAAIIEGVPKQSGPPWGAAEEGWGPRGGQRRMRDHFFFLSSLAGAAGALAAALAAAGAAAAAAGAGVAPAAGAAPATAASAAATSSSSTFGVVTATITGLSLPWRTTRTPDGGTMSDTCSD